jgi:chromosome segregation ATPase
MQHLIEAITAEIKDRTGKLAEAKQAALAVPELEADISRLQASLKALDARQTPKGRKAIGDAVRARKGRATTMAPPIACQHSWGDFHGETTECLFCGAVKPE